MKDCIEAIEGAFRALAAGRARVPLRSILWNSGKSGALGLMPALLDDGGEFLGGKIITYFPGNHGTELDSHQGVVLLFEGARGQILAIADASEITAIRTAAASGVATRLLARADAGDLALIGAGIQARSHLSAMAAVRSLRRVRVWSRDAGRARRFAESEKSLSAVPIEPIDTVQRAVAGADLICTVSAAREPILMGRWLAPGSHVNAVGVSQAGARELDTEAVVRASLYVDRRESALAEAGDFLFAKQEGAVDDSHIRAEIGEVLAGSAAGRRSAGEITLFKSVGLGIEDLAAVRRLYDNAQAAGVKAR